ncbi:right-handed parallel beta-helix repeat-containing protein [Nocardioides sp.]|uniref:right-handed parallel beta-helix repeat-containing protein n=1 Tax=Nocardioides sp. TaxID=35761 RepID=UPI003785041C
MNDSAPSAAERGDTVPGWVRWVVRLLAVAAFVAGAVAVAHVRNGDQEAQQGATPSATPAPARPSTATDATDATDAADPLAAAGREVRLLDAEDARLRAVSLARVDGTGHAAGTLVLDARPAPYTLADLLRAGAAVRTSPSVVQLTQPVVVRREARLSIVAPGTTLRLLSGAKGYTSLVSWGGSVTLAGTAHDPLVVESWDTDRGGPDTDQTDGRAYVRVKDGALALAHVRLADLGYWSGRTGGLAVTGSDETTATAALDDVSTTDLHLGLYVSGAQQVRAVHLRVRHPERHGVEITNRSRDVRLTDLVVTRAGEDAVSVSHGSSHVRISRAVLAGTTGGYGLDVDGSPLADGLNSAGYGIGNYAWVGLSRSTVRGNSSGGVRVQSVDHLSIDDSRVTADRAALVVVGAAREVTVADSELTSEAGTGLVLAHRVVGASVSGSTVVGVEVGVDVQGSEVAIEDNHITVGTGHGVLVTGPAAEATLSGNEIDGRGSGAVHGADGASVSGADTSTGDWTYRPEVVMWAERHAAALPLLLVLVVPLAGLVFVLRRRRQQRELRRIFESTLVARGRSAIDTYVPVSAPVPATEPGPVPDTGLRIEIGPVAGPVEEPVEEPVDEPGDETVPAAPAQRPALEDREFSTAREFAVAAVREAGYPPHMVARVLHVPTSRVREWVAAPAEQELTPV